MYKNYLRVAIRNIGRNKILSAINIFGLALGMTCCFLILIFVRDELSYDRFQVNLNRMYRVTYNPKFAGLPSALSSLSPAVSPLLKQYFPEIEESARLFPRTATIQQSTNKFQETRFFFADPAILKIFSFNFLEGNPQTALSHTFTILLSEKTAKKYFGDMPALGKSILLDGQFPFIVSGVFADYPDNSHIHMDLISNYETMFATISKEGRENLPSNWIISHSLNYVLLKPNQDPEKINSRFPQFLLRFATKDFAKDIEYRLQSVKDIHLRSKLMSEVEPVGSITFVYLFIGIATITLLIAGINFVNLSTAQSIRRAREVGMRKVLGAEKKQLILQFLGESVLMSFMAFLCSIALVAIFLPVFNELTQKHFLAKTLFSDGYLWIAFAIIFLLVGLLSGFYPALYMTGFLPSETLKSDFSNGKSSKGFLRSALMVFQFSASVALMIGAMVVLRQIHFIQKLELGFQKDEVLILPFRTNNINTIFNHPDDSLYHRLQAFRQSILLNPRVKTVTLSDVQPGQGAIRRGVIPEGFSQTDKLFAMNMKVDYNFIPAYGMKIVAGRNFSESFALDKNEGFIINETGVKRYHWKSPADAIGKQMIIVGNKGTTLKRGTIIGVVRDFHAESLFQPLDALLLDIDFRTLTTFSVKISPGNPAQTISFIRKNWNIYFPEKDFTYDYLDKTLNDLYESEQLLSRIIGYFAALAIFISSMGLFGLIVLVSQQRTREIGIRKVLGASVTNIVSLLSRDFLRLVLLAIVLGTPVAWWSMNKWLEVFAYRAQMSWWIFFASGALVIIISMLTISYQSIKAATANPSRSLRAD